MCRKLICLVCFVLTLSLTVGVASAGISYADPLGGWVYIYTGDKAATDATASLDGTWNHMDAAAGGSDAWDGSAPGQVGSAGAGSAPGGAGVFTEDDTTFLRIQDCGDPRDAGGGWADPSNRKETFVHDLGQEAGVNGATILDDGVTLSFRARIPTTPPLDNYYPDGGSANVAWTTRGYNIHDDGYGGFGIKQGTGGNGVICFSLAMDGDEGDISGNGLTMNKRVGTSPSGGVDSYDSGGVENTLLGFDPTQWHEFWIHIVADTSAGGTHKVTIWMDGNTGAPNGVFHVTAGTKDEYDFNGYLVMSLGRTAIAGAQDVDFFAYKPGLHNPVIAWPPEKARNPNPTNQQTEVPRNVVLSWKPGIYAPPVNGHKIYLSENFNDVNDGVGGITQDANSYTPSQRLNFGTTYYWRVDEVNGPPDYTLHRGVIWQFTTEPIALPIENVTATASSSNSADMGPEKTINGSGLDADDLHSKEPADMWLSSAEPLGAWIEFQFDKVYKLHQMWVWNSNQMIETLLGFGFKEVTIEYSVNGTDYTALGTAVEFAQAPGSAGYAHNTTVNFVGMAAKHVRLKAKSNWGGLMPQFGLSEVRFFYIPVWAREPKPDTGAKNVSIGTIDAPADVTLAFRAGREAAKHNVYFSADQQAVIDGTAPVTTVTQASYGPLSLNLGKTYYWRVDEVNEVETPATWQGDLWNFTTQEYYVVDDFESYNDLDTTDPASNRIFNTWIDGYGTTTNGSIVGYDIPPFAEKSIVHSGKQTMPFFYNNTAGKAYSEAERTFAVRQDWTKAGSQTLVLFFQGTAGNTGQLYVKVNGSKVVYGGDAADIAAPQWKQWNIDLVSLNVNLQNVTKLAVGIDGSPASGKLYFDDIRLYRLAP